MHKRAPPVVERGARPATARAEPAQPRGSDSIQADPIESGLLSLLPSSLPFFFPTSHPLRPAHAATRTVHLRGRRPGPPRVEAGLPSTAALRPPSPCPRARRTRRTPRSATLGGESTEPFGESSRPLLRARFVRGPRAALLAQSCPRASSRAPRTAMSPIRFFMARATRSVCIRRRRSISAVRDSTCVRRCRSSSSICAPSSRTSSSRALRAALDSVILECALDPSSTWARRTRQRDSGPACAIGREKNAMRCDRG